MYISVHSCVSVVRLHYSLLQLLVVIDRIVKQLVIAESVSYKAEAELQLQNVTSNRNYIHRIYSYYSRSLPILGYKIASILLEIQR